MEAGPATENPKILIQQQDSSRNTSQMSGGRSPQVMPEVMNPHDLKSVNKHPYLVPVSSEMSSTGHEVGGRSVDQYAEGYGKAARAAGPQVTFAEAPGEQPLPQYQRDPPRSFVNNGGYSKIESDLNRSTRSGSRSATRTKYAGKQKSASRSNRG